MANGATVPALILLTLVARTTTLASFTKSILLRGHLNSLKLDRRKREKKKSSFQIFCILLVIWHLKRPEPCGEEGKSDSALSLPTHTVTSKNPRSGQSKERPLCSGNASVSSSALLSHIKGGEEILDTLMRVPPNSTALTCFRPDQTLTSDSLAVIEIFKHALFNETHPKHDGAKHQVPGANMIGDQPL